MTIEQSLTRGYFLLQQWVCRRRQQPRRCLEMSQRKANAVWGLSLWAVCAHNVFTSLAPAVTVKWQTGRTGGRTGWQVLQEYIRASQHVFILFSPSVLIKLMYLSVMKKKQQHRECFFFYPFQIDDVQKRSLKIMPTSTVYFHLLYLGHTMYCSVLSNVAPMWQTTAVTTQQSC